MANLNFTGHIETVATKYNPFNESNLYDIVYKSIFPKVKKRMKTYERDNIKSYIEEKREHVTGIEECLCFELKENGK